MIRKPGRAALRALAVALAVSMGVLGAGAARASTTAATGQGPTQTCYGGNGCSYSSGWITYGDGGCEVETGVLFERSVNLIRVTVSVQSPYLFVGCTAVSTVHFGSVDGSAYSSGGFWGFACSETDFTCKAPHADPGTWLYFDTATGIPNDTEAMRIDSIWVTDTT